jgi:hypothetical protein
MEALVAAGVVLRGHKHQSRTGLHRSLLLLCRPAARLQYAKNYDVSGEDADSYRGDYGDAEN